MIKSIIDTIEFNKWDNFDTKILHQFNKYSNGMIVSSFRNEKGDYDLYKCNLYLLVITECNDDDGNCILSEEQLKDFEEANNRLIVGYIDISQNINKNDDDKPIVYLIYGIDTFIRGYNFGEIIIDEMNSYDECNLFPEQILTSAVGYWTKYYKKYYKIKTYKQLEKLVKKYKLINKIEIGQLLFEF